MTPEQKLDQDYQAVLFALKEEKNRQISDYQAQAWKMAQRASKAEAERDALQAELSSLKADMFVMKNDMANTTGALEDVLKQHDVLRARVGRALDYLRYRENYTSVARDAIKILTGEGE